MRDHGQLDGLLDVELYTRSQSQLRKLKAQLPQELVESLAREVLRRLTERDADMSVEAPSHEQIEQLCHALLSQNDQAGAAIILQARAAGASIDAVYLKYLASAARTLGKWWEEDEVSFAQVTLGTSRMYGIMRAMRHQLPIPHEEVSKTAIFASVPGETHTLGVSMAADLFRKDGWRIDLKIGESHESLVSEIVDSDAHLIGISAGGEHAVQALSRLIVALRIEKPSARIFVSGQVVEEARAAVNLIGVDGMADDLDSAKLLMNSLWTSLKER